MSAADKGARRRAGLAATIACAALWIAVTPAGATIRYDVSLARPAEHEFHVTMTIPNVAGEVTIQMPAWNALYQIRDFAYHMTDLQAAGAGGPGDALRVTKLDKQTWRIEFPGTPGAQTRQGTVRVTYATFWDDYGPFGTQLNGDGAFVNLAMVLCYVPARRAEDTAVHYADVPAGWSIAVELPQVAAGDATTFAAKGYDDLVDAPVELGKFDQLRLQAGGRPIRVVTSGDGVDRSRLQDMVTRIVNYETGLMREAPFSEYTFLFHVGRGPDGGGMEHANSTAIFVGSQDELPDVTAHEFFHLWNVKRIRPQSLEPVDYTREMYTRSLWFAEGVTDTYAAYTLVRSGLWTRAQFLQNLTDEINQLQTSPAHAWQSAEESSLDAWFEIYPLYNRPEFSISYYNKGDLLGVALDLAIRDATDNRGSLDDVLRLLNEKYAHAGRFYPESAGIREAAEEVIRATNPKATADLGAFFENYVAGTKEMPFGDLLGIAGLRLVDRGQSPRSGATTYSVEQIPNPSERQTRILAGLLQGTTTPAAAAANNVR